MTVGPSDIQLELGVLSVYTGCGLGGKFHRMGGGIRFSIII